MYINTTEQVIELVTIGDVKASDSLRVSIRYIDHGGGDCPLWVTFRPAIGRGHQLGQGWFVLDIKKSDVWVRSCLQRDALRIYQNLPWWRRFGRDRDTDIKWVERHVEFAVRSMPAGAYEQGWGRPPVKGQLVKGWWLQVIPLVDGKRVRDINFADDAFRFGWPVGEIVHDKAPAALSS
jgi:hypothetical protein